MSGGFLKGVLTRHAGEACVSLKSPHSTTSGRCKLGAAPLLLPCCRPAGACLAEASAAEASRSIICCACTSLAASFACGQAAVTYYEPRQHA